MILQTEASDPSLKRHLRPPEELKLFCLLNSLVTVNSYILGDAEILNIKIKNVVKSKMISLHIQHAGMQSLCTVCESAQ